MARNPRVFTLRVSSKRLPRWLTSGVRAFFDRLFGFKRFNAIYRALPPCEPARFSPVFLEAMQLRLELGGESLDTIPRTGPLIIIGNHPFGLIEGMALDAELLARRADVSVMVTYWLAVIPEFAARGFFVDPRRRRRRRRVNSRGWRQAIEWLAAGRALLVFPAGRVARFQWRHMAVRDMPWSSHIARIARRMRAPVLPIYIHGRCSFGFQLVGAVAPKLQDFLLIREATAMRGRTLRATVGRLIQPDEILRFATDAAATDFLRQETERLSDVRARGLCV
jgi:putative hemolysin